jgi:two-component system, OmpR family, phosphate regulon response regulator PhoB
MHTILVVDDEIDIAELVALHLQREGLTALLAHDGLKAVSLAQEHKPDLIVLDLMLPGKSGISVLKDLRAEPRTSQIPVIMLTAKGALDDRLMGFEMGVDDYVTKPFSPKELTLRILALLKRTNRVVADSSLRRGKFILERNTLKLYIDHEAIDLTATEFKLLRLLAESEGQVQGRDELLREVWGYQTDSVMTRTLDTHVKRLREKLGAYADCVQTVRGVGYRFLSTLEA